MRYGHGRDIDTYLRDHTPEVVDREALTAADREAEHVMLSLRLAEGIDRAAYRREHGRDPHALFAEVIARYPDAFRVSDAAIALTPRGMSVSNTLISEMLLCIE